MITMEMTEEEHKAYSWWKTWRMAQSHLDSQVIKVPIYINYQFFELSVPGDGRHILSSYSVFEHYLRNEIKRAEIILDVPINLTSEYAMSKQGEICLPVISTNYGMRNIYTPCSTRSFLENRITQNDKGWYLYKKLKVPEQYMDEDKDGPFFTLFRQVQHAERIVLQELGFTKPELTEHEYASLLINILKTKAHAQQ